MVFIIVIKYKYIYISKYILDVTQLILGNYVPPLKCFNNAINHRRKQTMCLVVKPLTSCKFRALTPTN